MSLAALLIDHPFDDDEGLLHTVDLTVTAGQARSAARDVAAQLGPLDRVAEALPELLLRARDDDPAVRRLEVLERDDRGVRRVAATLRGVPLGRHPRPDVAELRERGVEERDVAVAADPVASGAPERTEHDDCGDVSTGEIDQ